MGYGQKAEAALAELNALPVTRRSTTDPKHRDEVARWLLDFTKFDWNMINSVMFPDGTPLDLDLTNPATLQAWVDIRTNQLDIARGWVDSWVEKSVPTKRTVFSAPGLLCEVSTQQLVERDGSKVDPDAMWAILLKYFPQSFAKEANGQYFRPGAVDPLDPQPGEPKFAWLSRRLAYELGGLVLPSRVLANPSTLVSDVFRRGMENVRDYDWAYLVTHLLGVWESCQPKQAPATVGGGFDPSRVVPVVEQRLNSVRSGLTPDTALDQFSAWNIAGARASNAKSGRTWGIELEIIDAGNIAFDSAGGWERVRDGSLRQQIGDGKTYDPWEFVSPVLDTTFSKGLWMICDQARNTVKYHKAGVHVHVAATTRPKRTYDKTKRKPVTTPARRMTRDEVSRLLELYSSMTPLIDQIIRRPRTREFCVPTRVDQWVKGWYDLPKPKDPRKARRRAVSMSTYSADAIENARMWAKITKGPNHDAEPTEWKRHQEINLQALNKYGTIEFRSMGAVYDYEHLLKWAWMCRSMVDFAMSDAPMSELRSVTDMNSLIRLLNRYSQEPLSKVVLAAA